MSGPKHTPVWERVVTLDDHDALKRELAEERTLVGLMAETMDAQQDIIKRLAEALKGLIADIEALMEDTEGVETIDGDGMSYTMDWARLLPGGKYEYLTHWNAARAALREAGFE